MKNIGKVFILNKPFEGSYADEEGNVAHEIIDYFKADNNKIYIYNNPWGHCPSDIEVDDSKKYIIVYMLLAKRATMNKKDEEKSSEFELTRLFKIKRCLHNESTHDDDKKRAKSQKIVKEIISKEKITYGKRSIDQIYGAEDVSLYVTFEAEKVYEPKKPIKVRTPGYRFQRNKGYIYSDKHPRAFAAMQKATNLNLWKEVTNEYKCVNLENEKVNYSKSFLDLILKVDSEECYTNLLYSVLGWSNTLNLFLKRFGKGKPVDKSQFKVKRELRIPSCGKIKGGRTDVCAYTSKQKIVIENKIFSGLNGVNKDNKTTQLTIYHNWATQDTTMDPLCFITCPDYRKQEIELEIEAPMKGVYTFVGYSEVSLFIEELKKKNHFSGYVYEKYISDIVSSFARFGYKNKSELFEQLFIEEIRKV